MVRNSGPLGSSAMPAASFHSLSSVLGPSTEKTLVVIGDDEEKKARGMR
jgi:hypothetical protein